MTSDVRLLSGRRGDGRLKAQIALDKLDVAANMHTCVGSKLMGNNYRINGSQCRQQFYFGDTEDRLRIAALKTIRSM